MLIKIMDSDHCVALLRGQLDLTERISPDEDIAVTAISVGELVHGAVKSSRAVENLAGLDVMLTATSILDYDEWSARRFGQIKAILERSGEVISDLDLQIASIVLEQNGILLTHNRKHFSRLVDLTGLRVDDWLVG